MTVEVTKKQAEKVFAEFKKKYKWYITEGSQPTLVKDFQWTAGISPYAIVWEGGPYDWVYEFTTQVEGIYTEAYTGWAASIRKN